MSVTVKRIALWRTEVENQPGMLARALEPLATAGADLRLVMGYRFPETTTRAAVEVYPVAGKRATAAAIEAGLRPFDLACLLVEGDNRAGLGAAMARGLADAGVNIIFCVAQVVGRRFSSVLGFADEATATTATKVVKAAAAPPKKAARRKR